MPIQSTTAAAPVVYESSHTAPDPEASSFAPATARSRAGTFPPGERLETSSGIYRGARDDASRLYGSSPGGLQPSSREIAMGGIRHQLETICAPAQALEWKPVPGVRETLCALAQYVGSATATEKEVIGTALNNILKAATSCREKDVALLKAAIDRTIQGEAPMEVLGELAEAGLVLPNFKIRVDGQEEPPARHFDSTLLPFASASYDYGPLGRTLMLEGARDRFAGPSQAQRGEKLREVIFALPNPPASGEPLEGMSDIFNALIALGIDI